MFEVVDDGLVGFCSGWSDVGDGVFVGCDVGRCRNRAVSIGCFVSDGVDSYLVEVVDEL